MLTQCVQMTGKNIFEFEKKNLLIASKAPQWAGGLMVNPPPLNEGCCRGRQVGRDEQNGFD